MPPLALTRGVPPSIVRCELTHLARTPIDVRRAATQHDEYERTLAALGCRVERLRDAPEHPDSVFVEDTAVVLDELAVIARPGAESRRGETPAVEETLRHYRELHRIAPPGTLDGGDVLRLGKHVFIGRSRRTNDDGARQLRELLARRGYKVTIVPVRECLHLKSAVTAADDETLVVNPRWLRRSDTGRLRRIEIHPDEPHGANVLRVGDTLIASASAPRTRELLESAGYSVREIDLSELEKAEAGVTCCSIVLETSGSR